MKKFYFFLFATMISVSLFSNVIVYKSGNLIFLYDMVTRKSRKIVDMGDKTMKSDYISPFQIGSILVKNDSLMLTICYQTSENMNIVIYDREYLIDKYRCSLIKSSKIITEKIDKNAIYNIETIDAQNKETRFATKNISLKKYRDAFPWYDMFDSQVDVRMGTEENGDLFIVRNNNREILLNGEKTRNGEVCGFYNPDLSHDGKYIICTYECSKYSRRKLTSSIQLMEMNLKNRTIVKLNIKGTFPKYSNDDNFILCRITDGFVVFDRKFNKIVTMLEASAAYWVGR